MKIIAHIDSDSFYVSCERVRDPGLKGRPVAVLGNQGACVIARSYEIRPFGVKVGMPVWEAKKLCPDAIYIKEGFSAVRSFVDGDAGYFEWIFGCCGALFD